MVSWLLSLQPPSQTPGRCVFSLLAVRGRDRGNVTCLGQAPASESTRGRSQVPRPHPDLDGCPQTRNWMQTARDSGLSMLQRDSHLHIISQSEHRQCLDGSRDQNQNLQALWPNRNATVTFRGTDLLSPRTSLGNLNQLLHLRTQHASSHAGESD